MQQRRTTARPESGCRLYTNRHNYLIQSLPSQKSNFFIQELQENFT